MTSIEAVLFDFGGVLIEGPFEAFARYERERGLSPGFIRMLNATNHDDNAWARFERSELEFGDFCDAFEAEALAAGGRLDTRELFAMLSGSLRLDMVEALRRCSARFKTALLTNNFVAVEAQGIQRRADHAEVLALFDVVIESSVAGIRKPDPRFYLLACHELSVEPRHAVFLDDLGVNLKPARELGMTTIKVNTSEKALGELENVLGIPLR
jgi:putative hydrolase of the HAD superfamily